MQEMVDQVTFTRSCPPYRMGETAGFSPDMAANYVKGGFGTIERRGVPKVSPKVAVSDAQQQMAAIEARLNAAERDARKQAKTPDGAAAGADALRDVAEARLALDNLRRQFESGAQLTGGEAQRQAHAASGAV